MNINIKLLNNLAKFPTCADSGSAGYDLYSAISNDVQIPPHSTVKIGTGIALSIPLGYFGAIYARSGISTKRNLRPGNCVGIIDSSYRGEIIVALHNDSPEIKTVQAGERIAQLVIQKHEIINFIEVDELDETDRGIEGFGSTGDK